MKVINLISSKLPLLIILVSISTYFAPFYWQVPAWVPSLFLGVVIFFTGLSMNIEAMKGIRTKKRELLFVTLLKWTLTVFISLGLAHLFFSSKPDIAAGMILAGTVPSGTAATVYTFLAGGNTSLVITASLLDVVISPVVTPLAMLGLSNEQVSISFFSLLQSFVLIVVLPLGIGLFIQRNAPQFAAYSKSFTRFGSALALLLVVHTIVGSGKEAIFEEKALLPLIAVTTFFQVLLPMVGAYYLFKLVKFQEEEARAALFQVGLCNSALAAILAFQFIGDLGAIPPILNMIFNLSIGAFISNLFAKKLDSNIHKTAS